MAKILVAEDDEFLRDVLSDYLKSKGHEVTAVPNGKIAKDVALTGDFKLIISDVQMPFFNGVDFLQWVRERSQIPFILMTGFTNLLETKKASELGAQGFLSKPFANQDLMKLVTELLSPPKAVTPVEAASTDALYCKVSIDEFVARPKIDFDIYVRLDSGKYLKIAHSGETLEITRLKNYRDKGISYLHIMKADFNKLIDFNQEVSKILKNNNSVSKEKKARFMRYTGELIMEKCFVDDINAESFEEAREFFNTSMEALCDNQQMLDMMMILNDHSDHLYAHCLGVSIYSLMIAKQLNYTSANVQFKLAMAGMFHDIGKKEIEREVLEKSRPLLTVAERKLYESHVQRGREIMEAIDGIPADVVQMIFEHHEDDIEQGYPCRTPRLRLHPLSRVVHVANIFVGRALKSATNPEASALTAIAQMEKFDVERINTLVFAALKQLVANRKAA